VPHAHPRLLPNALLLPFVAEAFADVFALDFFARLAPCFKPAREVQSADLVAVYAGGDLALVGGERPSLLRFLERRALVQGPLELLSNFVGDANLLVALLVDDVLVVVRRRVSRLSSLFLSDGFPLLLLLGLLLILSQFLAAWRVDTALVHCFVLERTFSVGLALLRLDLEISAKDMLKQGDRLVGNLAVFLDLLHIVFEFRVGPVFFFELLSVLKALRQILQFFLDIFEDFLVLGGLVGVGKQFVLFSHSCSVFFHFHFFAHS